MTDTLSSLVGRRALVTGGSRGIGFELAGALAEAGAVVAITSRAGEAGTAVAEGLPDASARAVRHFAFDHQHWSASATLVDDVAGALGGLDILINNAGTGAVAPISLLSDEEIERLYGLNVSAPMALTRAALPALLASPAGRIINIASSLGLVGREHRTLYSATKGALIAFTKSLAVELAETYVTCNAIAPGQFHTSLTEGMFKDAAKRDAVTRLIPAKRWGQTRELRGALFALVGSDSGYINGHVLCADGGWTVW